MKKTLLVRAVAAGAAVAAAGSFAVNSAGAAANYLGGGNPGYLAATKATKSTIRVGVEGEFSGFGGSSNAGSADMARAWEKWVNATGGINGHPVKVNVVDDAGDPAKGLATIKTFREKDKALAMVSGGSTNVMPQVAPYHTRRPTTFR